jgi:integrase
MASFIKVPRKTKAAGWKAVIKRNGRVIAQKTFDKKSNAKLWAARIENDQEQLIALGLQGANIQLTSLADQYFAEKAISDNTAIGRIGYWIDKIGSQTLTSITTEDVRKLLDEYYSGHACRWDGLNGNCRSKTTSTTRKRSPASRNRMKAAISSLFRFAIDKGYIRSNPVRGIPALPENNKRVRWLSDDEKVRLLHACKESDWKPLYLLVFLAISTGARRGELLGLRWSDIDFNNRTALLKSTKNGESRVLTFPLPAIAVLKKFRKVGNDLIFASSTLPDRPMEYRKHWLRALKLAEIENFRFHDLRHTAASYLVMNGATLHEAGEVLGHKSMETTKRYAHLSVEHKKSLTDRILGGAMENLL